MRAILLVSHGSRSPQTKKEVASLVEDLKKRSGVEIFEYAFLEIEQPSIEDGIDHCISKGATKVVVLLNFLNSGRHVNEDIPEIIKTAGAKHPHVVIKMTTPVGQHPGIAPLFIDLINHA